MNEKPADDLVQILCGEYRSLIEDPEHLELEILGLLSHFPDETKYLLMSVYKNQLNSMSYEELLSEYASMLAYADSARLADDEQSD